VAKMDWAELSWRKSTKSAEQNCVIVTVHNNMVFVCDSKQPNGLRLELSTEQWDEFTRRIKGDVLTDDFSS
jgi:hypothetical protein